jgi:hypothetical protein
VWDETALVRNDPSRLLSQTNTWAVSVDYPDLRLTDMRWLGTNRFRFTIKGLAAQGYSVHGTTNWSNWFPLFTNSPGSGAFTNYYTNSTATNRWRFYKARTPPGP